MADTQPGFTGPQGDASRHRPFAALEAALRLLPRPDQDTGRVALIVRRRADHVRETPERVRLSLEEGVPGDDWSRRPPRDPVAQLAVMQLELAQLIANGQPLTLFGDNLFVELDLSTPNLPTGTRLRVGEAVVEVTPKPHNGCMKFKGRFGADALRFVQAPETRHENRRGIYWQVITPGEVCIGAPIEVIR
jgi:MOSC domain-containing protein YiiM